MADLPVGCQLGSLPSSLWLCCCRQAQVSNLVQLDGGFQGLLMVVILTAYGLFSQKAIARGFFVLFFFSVFSACFLQNEYC